MNTKEIIGAIPRGAMLIVQASFSPCGKEGLSPSEVITLLRGQLGPEGTLMMPTFSYNYSKRAGATPYDRDKTPGSENGILSETFRQTPGVRRSNNPTYSVAAAGKFAFDVTDGARDDAGLGFDSSYEHALKHDARILLLNVGNNRNSMLHYAEIASGVPYNDIPFRESWGRTALTLQGEMDLGNTFPACSEEFSKFDDLFVRQGFAEKLGGSFLIHAPAMVEFIIGEIRKQPDIMLCHDPECEPCSLRRKRLAERGLI